MHSRSLATAVGGGGVLSGRGDAGEELCVDPGRYCSTRFSAPVCRCMTSIYIIILVVLDMEAICSKRRRRMVMAKLL